tara:strand:- start:220 stop:603 length:384 start_codon:yes stop_codon:yes gene_type:complete
MPKTLAANQKNKNKQIKIIIMGYGNTNVSEESGIFKQGTKMGGGVKLAHGTKKESKSEDDVLSGKETEMENKAMAKVSGSHSKGKFMAPPKYKSHGSSPTKLKGGQVKLDKNKDGVISEVDFKMMKK